MSNAKQPHAQPPEVFTGIRIDEPPKVAAGTTAIFSAIKHVFGEMGVSQGIGVLNKINQFKGFDCPGCAWPDPDEKRAFLAEYCENGAKAIAEEATTKKADPQFFAKHSVYEMSEWSDYTLGKSGRLTHPMILREGATHYEQISWNDAFTIIAKELNNLSSPNEAIFYTSGRTSNEAAFLYQLFVRQFGTNNLPDCSNMCHESSGTGLSATVGIGKGSVTLEDFEHADLVIVMGQNPGTNHPRMLSALRDTKENGGKIISVNPLPEAGLIGFADPQKPQEWIGSGTQLTDLFLQVKINGDVALLKAIMKIMLDEERKSPGSVFDQNFIKSKTAGYEEFIASLEKENLDDLISKTGLLSDNVIQAAEMIMKNEKIIICWAMGLTQHKNGVGNIQEVVNLLLLKGSIGKKGAGTCPVRGHSNVQGDRTMGIWEKPKPAFLDKLKEVFDFEPPREHGYDVVDAIEAMHKGTAKVFFGMGGNFISATPDTDFTAEALKNCNLTVHVSTKPNRSHLIHGKTALILPCLGRSEADVQKGGEQFVTVENSMGVVHRSQGNLSPCSDQLMSEPAIVAKLATATLGNNTKTNWEELNSNYDLIRDKIEQSIAGFNDYNNRVRQQGGFYLPNNAREADFTPTPTGKANFTINEVPDNSVPAGHYMMMTIRTHDQYNTTIYGLDDRYRGIFNERRVILMNGEDMASEGLKTKDIVDITSHYEGKTRTVHSFLVVPYNIPKGCTATYFPEANALVPIKHKADKSGTPASKSIIITLKRS